MADRSMVRAALRGNFALFTAANSVSVAGQGLAAVQAFALAALNLSGHVTAGVAAVFVFKYGCSPTVERQ